MHANEYLEKWAESKLRYFRFWKAFNWWFYSGFVYTSYITGVAVPFMLAALLYISEEKKVVFSLCLLVVSGISLLSQVLCDTLRLRDRAIRFRQIYETLDSSFIKYKVGQIKEEDFIKVVENLKTMFIEEESK